MKTKPPFPVVLINGFKYFKHANGRTSASINGVYAKDYPLSRVVVAPDDFREPDDAEFIELMSNL